MSKPSVGDSSTFQNLINLIKSRLGKAAYKDIPTSGDAANDEVVLGSDTRLTDSRTPKSHTHTKSQISDFPTFGTAAEKDIPSSGNASSNEVVMGNDSRLTDARDPKSHTHTVSDINDFPTFGTAAEKDIPSSGNASSNEVVMGNDSRLTDARDPKSHTHTVSDINDFPTLGSASVKNVPSSGNAGANEVVLGNDSRLSDARDPKSHRHTVSDINDFPTLGSASVKNVPSSGNAGANEVVLGNDSRLSDARDPKSHTHTKSDISDLPTFGTAAEKDIPVSGDAAANEVVLGNDSRLTGAVQKTGDTMTGDLLRQGASTSIYDNVTSSVNHIGVSVSNNGTINTTIGNVAGVAGALMPYQHFCEVLVYDNTGTTLIDSAVLKRGQNKSFNYITAQTFTLKINGIATSVFGEEITDANGNKLSAKANDKQTFSEASTRANIASGETMPTLFGKIKKWFSDIKDLAFIAKDGQSSTKFLRGDGTWQEIDKMHPAPLMVAQNPQLLNDDGGEYVSAGAYSFSVPNSSSYTNGYPGEASDTEDLPSGATGIFAVVLNSAGTAIVGYAYVAIGENKSISVTAGTYIRRIYSVESAVSIIAGNLIQDGAGNVLSGKVNKAGDTMSGDLNVCSIYPISDANRLLGSADKRFYYAYMRRLFGVESIQTSTSGGADRVTLPTSAGTLALTSQIPTTPYQVNAGLEYVTKINNLGTTGYTLQDGYLYILLLSTVGLSGYQCKLYLAHTLYYSTGSVRQGNLSMLFSNTRGDGDSNSLSINGNVITEINRKWSSYLTVYRIADGYHAWP